MRESSACKYKTQTKHRDKRYERQTDRQTDRENESSALDTKTQGLKSLLEMHN
jgi:hypothetical protein